MTTQVFLTPQKTSRPHFSLWIPALFGLFSLLPLPAQSGDFSACRWELMPRKLNRFVRLSHLLSKSLTPPSRPYQPLHFPQSRFWSSDGSENLLNYPEWAANQANTVVEGLHRNLPITSILTGLAVERRQLAEKASLLVLSEQPFTPPEMIQNFKNLDHMFGRYRTIHQPLFYNVLPIGQCKSKEEIRIYIRAAYSLHHPKGEELLEARSELESNWPSFASSFLWENSQFRVVEHTTLDGLVVPATKIFSGGPDGVLLLRHPTGDDRRLLMEDFKKRITLLHRTRKKEPRPLTREEAISFALAMSAFYQAVDYVRGTSSIGRSFFAGSYYVLTGEPLRLYLEHDGIDLLAMTAISQEEFIEGKVLPFLLSQ